MLFNEKLIQELENIGLNNIHSLSLLLTIYNSELFNELELEEFIHESSMGEYLIQHKIIVKFKSKWIIKDGLFSSVFEDWKIFKTKLFTEYGFTLKGHPRNQIGYLIKNEIECANHLSKLLENSDIETILESANEYYQEGDYLKGLDKWLAEVVISSEPINQNKFIN